MSHSLFRFSSFIRLSSSLTGIDTTFLLRPILRGQHPCAFRGNVHHATEDEPQYFIKSDKTDHIAIQSHSTQTYEGASSDEGKEISEDAKNETLRARLSGCSSLAVRFPRWLLCSW